MSDALANKRNSPQTDFASSPSSMGGQREYCHTHSASNVSAYAAQNAQRLKKYRAIYILETAIRNIDFEARDQVEATKLATNWGLGFVGEIEVAKTPESPKSVSARPDAYGVENACLVLGGISRTSLYRLLKRGMLKRLPDTRKVLVTRRSIELYCGRAA